MNDNDAFLQAILANPDDDQLRLIYADWLEERGDPRGEFIRVQIELARPDLDLRRAHALLVREKELLAANGDEWVRPLGQLLVGWTFRRGFLDEVHMEAEAFVKHAPVLFRLAPVQGLRVHGPGGHDDLAECPYLARLHKLSFAICGVPSFTGSGPERIARSPHLSSLRVLELPELNFDFHGARVLAAAPALAGLVELRLNHNDIGDLGVQAILASPHLTNLRRLHVAGCDLTNTAATALARSDLIGQLETLDLSFNDKIDNAGIRALLSSRQLGALRSLGLGGLNINGLSIRALTQCKQLAGLMELDLSQTHVGDSGAEALADSPHLQQLSHLNLYQHRGISPPVKQRLQERFGSRVVL